MKTPNVLFNNCKKLIELYIEKDNINWGREIKIAKKLLGMFPIEFFEQYDPQTTIYSLSIFLTKNGNQELHKNFDMYKLMKPKEEIILQENPVINLPPVQERKSRTLQEFVDAVL